MISRVWHGWTKPENAAAYEALFRSEILPGIHRVPGFRGATLLRRSDGNEEEFVDANPGIRTRRFYRVVAVP